MADGEGQDDQEGQQSLYLLDGHMAGGRADAQRPYRELRKDGRYDRLAESQKDEGDSTWDLVTVLCHYFQNIFIMP